ncbi:hypothetical protein [Nonomuraea turkmeniaca]|uniref:hypothetical protein n=1 Tax=Nonomuraea turkmeniaca TaxID=103838 RepID=UPI001B873850|nr:hypothetical protein [Nonomuraea turkmeniaca]
MKLVVQVKLLPTPEQAEALEATLYQLNQAANQVSQLAFDIQTFGLYALRRRSCAFAGPADHIAALNVSRRAGVVWAFVNMPNEPAVASGLSASRADQPDRTARRKPRASTLGR